MSNFAWIFIIWIMKYCVYSFVKFNYSYYFFLRQGLTKLPTLGLSRLCNPGRLWTCTSASCFQTSKITGPSFLPSNWTVRWRTLNSSTVPSQGFSLHIALIFLLPGSHPVNLFHHLFCPFPVALEVLQSSLLTFSPPSGPGSQASLPCGFLVNGFYVVNSQLLALKTSSLLSSKSISALWLDNWQDFLNSFHPCYLSESLLSFSFFFSFHSGANEVMLRKFYSSFMIITLTFETLA